MKKYSDLLKDYRTNSHGDVVIDECVFIETLYKILREYNVSLNMFVFDKDREYTILCDFLPLDE